MNKIRYAIIVIALVILSSILSNKGYSKNDIVYEEGYSLDAKRLTKIMLLRKEDQIRIIGVTHNYFWWEENVASINEGNMSVASFPILKGAIDSKYSEKHIFIAIDSEVIYEGDYIHSSEFYYTLDYFKNGDKLIAFIHAVKGRSSDTFSSQEVLEFLREHKLVK